MSEPRGKKSSLDRAAQTGSCRLVGGSGAPSDPADFTVHPFSIAGSFPGLCLLSEC